MEESNHEENFCYEPCGCIITFSAGWLYREKAERNAGKISAGDYIQGYAEDPDAAELNATAILITVL